jgi:hypothetical protein
MYIVRVIKEWKQTTENGIHLTSGKIIQAVLYADEQVIMASEDELQIAENKLNEVAKKYDMKISLSRIFCLKAYAPKLYFCRLKGNSMWYPPIFMSYLLICLWLQ